MYRCLKQSSTSLCKVVRAQHVTQRFVSEKADLSLMKRTILWAKDKETILEPINPATLEVGIKIEMDNPQTVKDKFIASKRAQRGWREHKTFQERADIIRRFSDLLQMEKEVLAETLSKDMGKPITQAKSEIEATSNRINFFLENTEKLTQDRVVYKEGNMEERVSFDPLGVVLNVSAWNYPYFVGSNVWIPALLTGSSVLYKSSELVATTGQHITRLMHNAGAPDDIFTHLIGKAGVAEAAVGLPVDGVFFTGSYPTGLKIAKRTAPYFTKTQLELGGKGPIYVTEDANIANAAASIAEGAFYNTGQSCCSVDRVYVHRDVYDKFEQAFVEEVKKFSTVQDPLSPEAFIGPVAREQQLGFLEHLTHHAIRRGAKLLLGGKRDANAKGWYFMPTVLGHCNHSMEIMHHESFGPIVGLQKVNNDDDATSLMNDSTYGLTAGVFSTSQKRAIDILKDVDTGSCYWNACDRVSPRLPWTGVKHSGMGSTLGEEGIRAFLKPKAWHLRTPPAP